jgi:hypothetical protein
MKTILRLLLSIMPFCAYSQAIPEEEHDELISWYGEVLSQVSSAGITPFWNRNNTFGTIPNADNLIFLKGGIHTEYVKPHKNNDFLDKIPFDYGYGFEGVFFTAPQLKPILSEAYLKLRYHKIEFWMGRRREVVGLGDSTLSVGPYIQSGAALPIPKVQIGLYEYTPLKFLNNLVAIRGFIANGFYTNSRADVRGAMLHQKALYLRFGRVDNIHKFYVGLNHQVQWAGTELSTGRDLGSDIGSFGYVFLATKLTPTPANIARYGANDAYNRVGNHLGTVDLGMEWTWDLSELLVYRQHLYDDGSLLNLMNLADGLTGIRYQNRQKQKRTQKFYLKKMVFEYLNTQNQGGGVFQGPSNSSGSENYFNNSVYTDGWSYLGQSVGTSFLTPQGDFALLSGRALNYFDDKNFTFNNRVSVFHWGAEGKAFYNWYWESRLSYSQNYGTYAVPFDVTFKQWSGSLRVSRKINSREGLQVFGSLGFDIGDLYRNTIGLQLGIRKTWWE